MATENRKEYFKQYYKTHLLEIAKEPSRSKESRAIYNKGYSAKHKRPITAESKELRKRYYQSHKGQIYEYNRQYRKTPKYKEWYKNYQKTEKRKSIQARGNRKYRQSTKGITTIKAYNQTPLGRELQERHSAKRRQLGFVPLNKPFKGCEGHHIDFQQVIYIPKEIHRSVWHSVLLNINMEKINKLAFEYLETENRVGKRMLTNKSGINIECSDTT